MPNLSDIVKGFSLLYSNRVFDKDIVKKRISICRECEYLQKGYTILKDKNEAINEIRGYLCGSCKCYLAAKVLLRRMKCPEHKW